MSAPLPQLVCGSAATVEVGKQRLEWRELAEGARRVARGVSEMGYERGAGLLVGLTDPVAGLEVALGAWWAGLRVAFLRPDLPLSSDEQSQLVHAAAQVLDDDEVDSWPKAVHRDLPAVTRGELLGRPVPWGPRCAADDVAVDLLTSGTTGVPRCVAFSHAALAANAVMLAECMGLGRDDRIWTSLPYGLPGVICTVLLPAALRDATAVLSAPGDPLGAATSLCWAGPSVVYAVPAVYEALARLSPRGPGQVAGIRWWLSSSAGLSPRLFDAMRANWGALVRSFYCGSEIGTVTFNAESDPGLVRSTVGRPLPGVRLAVGGRDAGPLTVTGPMIGIGYRTGAVVTPFPDAAVETTDIGFVDDDGLVHIVGRQDDRVHVGSEVVDPLLIEDKVRDLDGVDDCLAVARPHERLGHVLELHVVRAGRRTLSERDVIAHCRSQGLKGAWVPRSVRWVDVVPKTPAGKPRRTLPRN